MEYIYKPAKFESTTEKQESYKQWDLPSRPPRPPMPMRPILPFTGLPLLMTLSRAITTKHHPPAVFQVFFRKSMKKRLPWTATECSWVRRE